MYSDWMYFTRDSWMILKVSGSRESNLFIVKNSTKHRGQTIPPTYYPENHLGLSKQRISLVGDTFGRSLQFPVRQRGPKPTARSSVHFVEWKRGILGPGHVRESGRDPMRLEWPGLSDQVLNPWGVRDKGEHWHVRSEIWYPCAV